MTNRAADQTRKWLTVLLFLYWTAMFVGTHIPKVPKELDLPGGDKSQHFTAYGGLAFLLSLFFVLRRAGEVATWKKSALRVFGIAAIYGAFDEITQIPVGRHADVLDWCADIAGAAIGIGLFWVVARLWSTRGKT